MCVAVLINAYTSVTQKVYLILILSLEVIPLAFIFFCVLRQLVPQFLQTLHGEVSRTVQQHLGSDVSAQGQEHV